jgi:hypothetical protein
MRALLHRPKLKTGLFSYSGEFQMLKMFIAAVGGVALFIFLERWLPLRETPVTASDDLDQPRC